jgi:large subunit ribosomal protein L24
MANKLKKGDEVVVISGDHKGNKGKILQMLREKNRVIVEGVNMIKKHEKKTQDNPQGAIIEREASLHFSNVRRSDPKNK